MVNMVEFADFNGNYRTIDRSYFPILVRFMEREQLIDSIDDKIHTIEKVNNTLNVLYTLDNNLKVDINSIFILHKDDELDLIGRLNDYFGSGNYKALEVDLS